MVLEFFLSFDHSKQCDMKNLFLFAATMFLLISCATKQINFDQLQDRNGLYYLVNDKEPFTGEIISYSGGKVELEGTVKNGLREGLWVFYFPNGQKKMEGIYKDGLKEGSWTYWAENGEQDSLEVYKMGTRLGNDQPVAGQQEKPESTVPASEPSKPAAGGGSKATGQAQPAVNQTQTVQESKKEEAPKPVNWDWLTGGPVKYYQGRPYTGPVVKYYKEGSRGVYLEGHFTNGYRTGKWTYYDRAGRVTEIKYY